MYQISKPVQNSFIFRTFILPILIILAVLSNNICEHPVDQGECTGDFTRFAYNTEKNECHKIVYGGCGGNGNNFPTFEDCRMACVKGYLFPRKYQQIYNRYNIIYIVTYLAAKCPPEPACDAPRCQLVKDLHGCPLCSCPPMPRHPPLGPRKFPQQHLKTYCKQLFKK